MLFGRHINKFYLRYWYLFLLGIIALIVVDYAQLELPEIYGKIINSLKNDGRIETKDIISYMIRFGVIALIIFVGRFTWRNCIFGVGVRIESDLREDMFKHSEKLSQAFYKEHKTGALMAYYTNDLQMIRECFGSGTIFFIDALFLGIFTYIKMIRLNTTLSLYALIPMVLICIISLFIGRIMERKFLVRQRAYELLSDYTQENFSGISVIKAFVKETLEIKEFARINKNNEQVNISFARYSTILNVLLNFILYLIIIILLGGGAYYVINDGTSFDVGELAEFISYFGTITWPLMAISQLINMIAQGRASLKRVSSLLNQPIEIKDENPLDVKQINGSIEFKNLSFKYPDGGDNVLENISFKIDEGQMVGIVGKTGCGKTTIVDLLLRIYNVKRDEIYIDGHDILDLPFKAVRESIGYVPQDNFLFSDTIRNNIGFAFKEVDEENIIKAASLADVHDNILGFDKQYATILGERGVTLSGGQKQRVSIARALIKNPPILILDDSVSAVDTKTEESILTNLKSLRKGKTTIVIAHRISTVKDLDKIIVMDNGHIVGIGTHDELMASSSEYQEMVHLQTLEKEVEGE